MSRRSIPIKITRQEFVFVGFLLLFCTVFTLVELKNGRLWTNDFRVYYEAVHDFFAGNNPYKHSYGLDTGFFKYAPFTLYLFSPKLLVPYGAGQAIHLALLAASLIISTLNLKKIVERQTIFGIKTVPYGFLYLLFACVAIHITRELHLGNINLLLLLFFNLGLRASFNQKWFRLAFWWSIMIVLKPIMIVVVLPLLFTKQWKALLMMFGFGILFFLFPAVHLGFSGNWVLWTDWFKAISAHGDYLTSYNQISTLVQVHTGFTSGWIISVICLIALTGLMFREIFQLKKTNAETVLVWSVIFAAFIPNFFLTDTEHFLLSAPLIWLLFAALRNSGKWYHWLGFSIGMLLFSFNSSDLLGNLSDFVYNHGFLGIGNLVFIASFLWVRKSAEKTRIQE